MSGFRLTKADVALMKRCKPSHTTFVESDVLYRDVGMAPRSYRLWHSEHVYETVTPRVKRLLRHGLVEHDPFLHRGAFGGEVVLTEAGRAALALVGGEADAPKVLPESSRGLQDAGEQT